ncbi:MAG: RNA polymerase subunit sigma-24 [Bacteroidetes bacterium CG2_30_33_31]|nr:MAG: RNA polymerase subunit sigma-24 [Bacteroidetes bacterium CG2_30_33_31]
MTTSEYNRCVDEYSDSVFRFVLKNLRDEEQARDVVQDAFMKMWEKAATITNSKAKSYLFTAAYHTMIDSIRREKKYTSSEEISKETFVTNSHYSDLKEILDEAFSILPEVQKSVLLLRDYEGYSYADIGEVINLNESQVKVYIYRARLAMKKYIGSMEMVI